MSKKIPYEEIAKNVRKVKPFHWVNQNLTVVAVSLLKYYHVFIVEEPGYDGECFNEDTIVFTKRGNDVPESNV